MPSPTQARRNQPPPDRLATVAQALERIADERPNLSFLVEGGELRASKSDDRANLLQTYKQGGISRLVFKDTPYIQRATPNRKYVRHAKGNLKALAASYEGMPYIKDHNTWSLDAAGGTILQSKLITIAEGDDAGAKAFEQTTEAVKPWAIEGLLDGTIKFHSIAWHRNGEPPWCSLHEAPVGSKCWCCPGDEADGKNRIEWIFPIAVGTEKSAVIVPAVVGTTVDEIRGLAAVDRQQLFCILSGTEPGERPHTPTKERQTMKISARLALALAAVLPKATQQQLTAEEATEEDAIRAAGAISDELSAARARLSELESAASARKAADEAAEVVRLAAEKSAQKAETEAAITRLAATGKIKPKGEQETALRAMADREGGFEMFRATVKDLEASKLQATPVGAGLPAANPAAKPTTPAPTGSADKLAEVDEFLAENPKIAEACRLNGLTRQNLADNPRAMETLKARRAAQG